MTEGGCSKVDRILLALGCSLTERFVGQPLFQWPQTICSFLIFFHLIWSLINDFTLPLPLFRKITEIVVYQLNIGTVGSRQMKKCFVLHDLDQEKNIYKMNGRKETFFRAKLFSHLSFYSLFHPILGAAGL
jgi:hypothetical protein